MVTLRKNKTCNGCKALHMSFNFNYCELGYNTSLKTHPTFFVTTDIPTEICPKPKTTTEYIEARENFRKKS